jgi:hypothetical protein
MAKHPQGISVGNSLAAFLKKQNKRNIGAKCKHKETEEASNGESKLWEILTTC